MGGTFDRLHNGHKIMLSEAVLLTRNQLLIGTTSETMLKRKKLAELIQSFELRCESVHKFLNHVNPNLKV
jgi:phosphopantetheine adenylyltransferase